MLIGIIRQFLNQRLYSSVACSVTDAILERRSVRDFTDEIIEDDVLKEIIKMSNFAPSGRNAQPLKYYTCDDMELLKDISDVCMKNYDPSSNFKDKNIFYNSAVTIFVTWKGGVSGDEFLDAGLAMQNMQLFAHSKGIGSCCIGLTKYGSEYIHEVLEFGEDEVYTCAVIFGYPNPERKLKTPRRKDAKIVRITRKKDDDL